MREQRGRSILIAFAVGDAWENGFEAEVPSGRAADFVSHGWSAAEPMETCVKHIIFRFATLPVGEARLNQANRALSSGQALGTHLGLLYLLWHVLQADPLQVLQFARREWPSGWQTFFGKHTVQAWCALPQVTALVHGPRVNAFAHAAFTLLA